MRNIVLVGFMGTGKTTVAKAVARKLKMTYVSTDKMIEKREKKPIKNIFAKKGEKYFRKVEKEVVKTVSELSDQVIDAGGGVVLDARNLDALKKGGIVICLWADLETILKRTKRHTKRPLLNVADPERRIRQLLEYREPFYMQADFHIDTTPGDVRVVADRVVRMVKLEEARRSKKDEIGYSARLWKLSLDELLQNSASPIRITDKKGKVLFTNKKYKMHFGKAAKRKKHFYWISCSLKKGKGENVMFVGRPVKGSGKKTASVQPADITEIVDTIFASSKEIAPEVAEHSRRVTLFAVDLAKKVKMNSISVENLRIAALLHDIGKLAVDEQILFKEDKLREDEFDEIKKHPGWGVKIIRPVSFLSHILPIIISHHENYNGKGYPNGIEAEEIPFEARVLSIADVYEALTADRPYRKAFSKEKAVEIIKTLSGKKLDPGLTDIFLEMVKTDELSEEAQ